VTAADAHALADPLAQAYAKAWAEVESWERKLVNNPKQEARRRRLEATRRQIEADMGDLDEQSIEWLSNELPKVYLAGGTAAGDDLIWNQVHQHAAQRLANGLHTDLLHATQNVVRSTKDLVRTVAKDEQLRLALSGQETAVSAGRRMAQILKAKGVTALVYEDGSRHGLAEYSQMAIRTTTASAYNLGTLNATPGVGRYEVFDGPNCGWSTHNDPQRAHGLIVTREEAEAHLISHPNCRRAFGPRPDLEPKKPESSESERWSEGRDVDVKKASLWNKSELEASRQALGSWQRQVEQYEADLDRWQGRIDARKKELRDVYGITGSKAAAAMRRETNMRWARESVDSAKQSLDKIRAELATYEQAVKDAEKRVVELLPEYDPDNPLRFYGNRVTIYDDHPSTLENVRQFEALPQRLHQALRDYYAERDGGGIFFADRDSVVDMDGLGRLRGVATRESGHGRSSTRLWDEVPGVHSPRDRVTAVGNGAHGSHSVARHEASHALDDALGRGQRPLTDLTGEGSFQELLDTLDLDSVRPMNPYYTALSNPTGWRSELFAEAFSTWLDARSKGRVVASHEIAKQLGIRLGGVPTGSGVKVGLALGKWFETLMKDLT